MALATPCWECQEVLGSTWTWVTMSRGAAGWLQGWLGVNVVGIFVWLMSLWCWGCVWEGCTEPWVNR